MATRAEEPKTGVERTQPKPHGDKKRRWEYTRPHNAAQYKWWTRELFKPTKSVVKGGPTADINDDEVNVVSINTMQLVSHNAQPWKRRKSSEISMRKCPTIKIECEGVETEALVDTGCTTTVVSEELYEELKAKGKQIMYLPMNRAYVIGATQKKSSPITKQIMFNATIGDQSYEVVALVVKKLLHPIIIGTDFLVDQRAIIDLERQVVELGSQAVEFDLGMEEGYETCTGVVSEESIEEQLRQQTKKIEILNAQQKEQWSQLLTEKRREPGKESKHANAKNFQVMVIDLGISRSPLFNWDDLVTLQERDDEIRKIKRFKQGYVAEEEAEFAILKQKKDRWKTSQEPPKTKEKIYQALVKSGKEKKAKLKKKTYQLSEGKSVLLRVPRVSNPNLKLYPIFFLLYEGPYFIDKVTDKNVARLLNDRQEVVGHYNFHNLRPCPISEDNSEV